MPIAANILDDLSPGEQAVNGPANHLFRTNHGGLNRLTCLASDLRTLGNLRVLYGKILGCRVVCGTA